MPNRRPRPLFDQHFPDDFETLSPQQCAFQAILRRERDLRISEYDAYLNRPTQDLQHSNHEEAPEMTSEPADTRPCEQPQPTTIPMENNEQFYSEQSNAYRRLSPLNRQSHNLENNTTLEPPVTLSQNLMESYYAECPALPGGMQQPPHAPAQGVASASSWNYYDLEQSPVHQVAPRQNFHSNLSTMQQSTERNLPPLTATMGWEPFASELDALPQQPFDSWILSGSQQNGMQSTLSGALEPTATSTPRQMCGSGLTRIRQASPRRRQPAATVMPWQLDNSEQNQTPCADNYNQPANLPSPSTTEEEPSCNGQRDLNDDIY